MKTKLFNHKLSLCEKNQSTFSDYAGTLSITDNHRAYSQELGDLAENFSILQPSDPIGEGTPNQKGHPTLGPKFSYNQKGHWESSQKGYTIKILPTCPIQDAATWLKTFKPIAENILHRGIAGKKPIQFILGTTGAGFLESAVASANPETRETQFYLTKNQKGLISTAIQNATKFSDLPIKLSDIILHEIAHTLAYHLDKNLGEIHRSISTNRQKIEEFSQTISPHYLGKQWKRINHNLDDYTTQLQKGKTTAKLDTGREVDLPSYRAQALRDYSEELFAEAVRYFYLIPSLTGEIPPEPKTGWEQLDDLTHRLIREAKINNKKENLTEEPFPPSRAQKKLPIIEAMQDFLA